MVWVYQVSIDLGCYHWYTDLMTFARFLDTLKAHELRPRFSRTSQELTRRTSIFFFLQHEIQFDLIQTSLSYSFILDGNDPLQKPKAKDYISIDLEAEPEAPRRQSIKRGMVPKTYAMKSEDDDELGGGREEGSKKPKVAVVAKKEVAEVIDLTMIDSDSD